MPGLARRALLALATFAVLAHASPPAAGPARYRRFKLFELFATADCVVAGEITWLTEDAFDLWVETAIAGDPPRERLSVSRFVDWTCASRWAEYAVGQRVVLFLHSTEDGYRILGGGGEGEMPFSGDSVVVRGYSVHGLQARPEKVLGGASVGPLVPLQDFVEAVRAFRGAFAWGHDARGRVERFDFQDEPRAVLLRDSSPLGNHLYEEVVSSESWAHERPAGKPRALEPLVSDFPADARCLSATPLGLAGFARLADGRVPDGFGFQLDPGLGRSCAALGDVDGNGVDDYGVGAPSDSYLGPFRGALWILLMGKDAAPIGLVEISDAASGVPSLNDRAALGSAVAALGDLDGDGVPDVAVGAPGRKGVAEGSGGVWVLFLDRGGKPTRSVELGHEQALLAAGVGGAFGLGSALANLGDLDGDGSPELAIGQRPRLDVALEDGPRVLIVSLDQAGHARWVERLQARDTLGTASHYMFGSALAGLGDVDRDGVPDLAVGDPWDSDGGEYRGAVWIVSLGADGTSRRMQKISAWEGGLEDLMHDGEHLGRSLASPGDLDGDRVPDLLAGRATGISVLFLKADGTVKRRADVKVARDPESKLPEVGLSMACGQAARGLGALDLLVGGAVGLSPSKDDGALWLVRLARDGRMKSQ